MHPSVCGDLSRSCSYLYIYMYVCTCTDAHTHAGNVFLI